MWPAAVIAAASAFDRFSSRAPSASRHASALAAHEHLAHRREPALELRDVDVLEALEHHGAPRVALVDDAAADLLERGARQRLVRDQLVEELEVTSSSRTVPSAWVRRRILPRALPAFVPLTPAVSTGTASRRRREATRA